MKNAKILRNMKMKNIYLLLIFIGLSIGAFALPYWTAKDYFNKGKVSFRSGDYAKAAAEFEYATYKDNDTTMAMDSIHYMMQLSLYCKNHKDSGNVLYELRKYIEASKHYELVCKHNSFDTYCRNMMGACMRKGKKGAFAGMKLMTPGNFKMGRNDGPINEQPCHIVELSSYYIDQAEVTNVEFALFLNINGLYSRPDIVRIELGTSACHIVHDPKTGWFSVEEGFEQFPVLGVTWYGANDYAHWVGKSLPTEAQWEYAFGDALISEDAYYHEVGSGVANRLGIYGMADNGREWVEDWYSDTAYECADPIDPVQHEILEYKSIRGSKSGDDDFNPATIRDFEPPTYGGSIGFRCVKNISHIR